VFCVAVSIAPPPPRTTSPAASKLPSEIAVSILFCVAASSIRPPAVSEAPSFTVTVAFGAASAVAVRPVTLTSPICDTLVFASES
jgi:hypothetical protein